MSSLSVIFACMLNGAIEYESDGVFFSNGETKCFVASSSISFEELKQNIYHCAQWDKKYCDLNITGRVPCLIKHPNSYTWVAIPVTKDDEVRALVNNVGGSSGYNCVQLLVNQIQVNASTHSFMNLLNQQDTCMPSNTMSVFYNEGQSSQFIPSDPAQIDRNILQRDETQLPHLDWSLQNDDMIGTNDDNEHRGDSSERAVDNDDILSDSEDEAEDAQPNATASVFLSVIPEIVDTEDPFELPDAEVNNDRVDNDITDEMETEILGDSYVPTFDAIPNTEGGVNVNQSSTSHSWTGELYKGKLFSNKGDLMHALNSFSISNHCHHKMVESKRDVVHARCKDQTCRWKFRAYVKPTAFDWKITIHEGPHTCRNTNITRDHRHLSSKYVAKEIKEMVRHKLDINPITIIDHIMGVYGYQITYWRAWQGKQKAIELLFGSWQESFAMLPRYLDHMLEANRGSITHLDTFTTPEDEIRNEVKFHRVFWAFQTSKLAFTHCRPVISIDGTFLRGKYPGTLLIAVAMDGNQKLLPLAHAIVESENISSWCWFMNHLREFTDRKGLCVVSDRHVGIIHAMNHLTSWKEPEAYHRYCSRHFTTNFHKKFNNTKLTDQLMMCASVESEMVFNKCWKVLLNIAGDKKDDIVDWIEREPREKWALAFDGGRRFGMMTTNISEVYNSVLKDIRSLPPTAIVQLTFHRLNSYFVKYRKLSEEWANTGFSVTPYAREILEEGHAVAMAHTVEEYNHEPGLFTVTARDRRVPDVAPRVEQKQYAVNFCSFVCSCFKWQNRGIPCSHVIAVCLSRKVDYTNYVFPSFLTKTYVETWKPVFNPVLIQTQWKPYNGPKVVPDMLLSRKPGRKKSKRIYNDMDRLDSEKQLSRCGFCRGAGHNRRKCPHIVR